MWPVKISINMISANSTPIVKEIIEIVGNKCTIEFYDLQVATTYARAKSLTTLHKMRVNFDATFVYKVILKFFNLFTVFAVFEILRLIF